MNRRNQNFTAPENWRSNRQEDHHGTMYVNRMGTRNNRTNFQSIPRPFPAGPSPFPPNPREVVLEPWRLFQERSISRPLAIPPSYPEQRGYYPDHQMIYVDNQRRPTPSFPEPSSSAPTTQQGGRWINAHSPEEDASKLTQDEQKQALNKLKKEVYFPTHPKRGRRPNLYFREHYNSLNSKGKTNDDDEDEDGKRCAVCLDDFEAREVVMVTPCNHMFHKDCIIPWVRSQGRCPVCRYAICERFRENAAAIPSNINVMGNHHEPYEVELISIIRAMEEAFMSENMTRFH